ncbi:MAG: molecular chaperone, partial [Desulfamplus sp.]|nr:molecular chaperone [Desulfamplus sp.]
MTTVENRYYAGAKTFCFKILILSLILLWCILFITISVSASTKGVMLTPTRVVFEGRTRAEVVRLINTNETSCSYRISLVTIRMDDFGNKTEVESPTPEELAVQNMIRFSPRSATIAPSQWQTIRLMVRKPSDLAPGEYRVQLKVVPLPDPASPSDSSSKNKDNGKIGIQINYIVAMSIPIIIRHGKGDVKVIPESTVLQKSESNNDYFLETGVIRDGLFSLYGDITAFHTPLGGGERIKIGEIKGISIYTPNTKQILKIPVSIQNPLSLYQGKIDIEVTNSEDKSLPVIGSGQF